MLACVSLCTATAVTLGMKCHNTTAGSTGHSLIPSCGGRGKYPLHIIVCVLQGRAKGQQPYVHVGTGIY